MGSIILYPQNRNQNCPIRYLGLNKLYCVKLYIRHHLLVCNAVVLTILYNSSVRTFKCQHKAKFVYYASFMLDILLVLVHTHSMENKSFNLTAIANTAVSHHWVAYICTTQALESNAEKSSWSTGPLITPQEVSWREFVEPKVL